MAIRLTVKSDIEALNVETFGETFRGLTVVLDDAPVGVIGVLHSAPMQLISVIDDRLRKSPRSILEVVKMATKMLDKYDCPIYALAVPEESGGARLLTLMGFEFVSDTDRGGLYRWVSQQ